MGLCTLERCCRGLLEPAAGALPEALALEPAAFLSAREFPMEPELLPEGAEASAALSWRMCEIKSYNMLFTWFEDAWNC